MSEHGLLRASDWAGWSICPGKPYLEDREPEPVVEPRTPSPEAFRTRVEWHQGAGASVQQTRNGRLDLSVITGERHASSTADYLLIAQYDTHSMMELWQEQASEEELMFLAFAAFLHHTLLHNFNAIVLHGLQDWTHTPDDLYVFGQQVTEAAHRALSIHDEPSRDDLVPGPQCCSCRASGACPALARREAEALV